jgi:hypothetical protein
MSQLSAAWLAEQVVDINQDTIITADEVLLSHEIAAKKAAGQVRWASFVNHFNLKNVDEVPAPYAKKSIYFLPNCKPHMPTGTTGGENFGVLAKIPVLVE